MKGDFSRLTFDPRKHYLGTLMQQGRVQLDADWNEQQAIHRHRHETGMAEIIGPAGVPNEGGGFAITVAAGGERLSISAGRIHVDGLLCENAQAVTLDAQPHLPDPGLPRQPGRYLAYLEVWERHVTAAEDPQIREKALGGVDTATRSALVWQVKLTGAPVGGTAGCGDFPPGWSPAGLSPGKMSARTTDAGEGGPCVLPGQAGYRGLENQLYRVEVHRGGRLGDAVSPTFKWSRDNGIVTTLVNRISGTVLTVDDLGKDAVLGFAAEQWVEVIDREMELAHQRGRLVQIEAIDRSRREITIKAATPLPAVDTDADGAPLSPLTLRRWDNPPRGAAAGGIPITPGPLPLGGEGIEVRFQAGLYQAGDYWLIPARTVVSSETGNIEWPLEGDEPRFLPPEGIRRHYAPLALVDFDSATRTFTRVEGGDCRRPFPALTAISAADVRFDSTVCQTAGVETVQEAIDALCRHHRGSCTLTPTPGPGWERIFQGLENGRDASVCFPAGEFPLDRPLVLKHKGNLVFRGAGKGTRIVAARSEAALIFEDCGEVAVQDLYAAAGRAAEPAAGPAFRHLNGTFSFRRCRSVTVEGVGAECADGRQRAAACITVAAAPAGDFCRVRIRRCALVAGHRQTGILLVNPLRAVVEDNSVQCREDGVSPDAPGLLNDAVHVARLRKLLFSNLFVGNEPPAGASLNAEVAYRGKTIRFKTDPSLAGAWHSLLDAFPPPGSPGPKGLARHLQKQANRLIRDPSLRARFPAFRTWFDKHFRPEPKVGSQGIVIGGGTGSRQRIAVRDVRILNNFVSGFQQGIHVGVSHRERAADGERFDRAGRVAVTGNTIEVFLTSIVRRERHGIFVGNCDSLLVADNYVTVIRHSKLADRIPIDGIKLFGFLGPMVIVRQNHLEQLKPGTGIRVKPLGTLSGTPQWLVSDNVMPKAEMDVQAPAAVVRRNNLR